MGKRSPNSPVETMRYKADSVRLSRRETDNNRYKITTREDVKSLVASIETAGLVNPPLLLPAKNHTYIIVSGFRRVKACSRLGWARMGARLLSPDIPPEQCALAAIADNCSQRELNLIEMSRAVNLLSDSFADDTTVAAMAVKAGLPVAMPILPKIRALCNLPMPLQQGVVDATLSLPMAERLQRMPAEDAREAFDLFCEIRAGLNVQREILDNAEESARREGVSLKDILRSDAVLQIRVSDEPDRSRKTGQVRKLLKERRYPALSAAEETFKRQLSSLDLRRDMKLVPPAGFEGPDYSLALKFSSIGQLQKQRDVIDRLLNSDVLRKVLD